MTRGRGGCAADGADPVGRRATLLRIVEQRGYLALTAAALATGASVSTVRRDLDRLARYRLVERVPGGALAPDARI